MTPLDDIHQRFAAGVSIGTGTWDDQRGQHGSYTARCTVSHDGPAVRFDYVRTFAFEGLPDPVVEVSALVLSPANEADALLVELHSEGSIRNGDGHIVSDTSIALGITVSPTNRIELTYATGGPGLATTGSATNNGNHTTWTEALAPAL